LINKTVYSFTKKQINGWYRYKLSVIKLNKLILPLEYFYCSIIEIGWSPVGFIVILVFSAIGKKIINKRYLNQSYDVMMILPLYSTWYSRSGFCILFLGMGSNGFNRNQKQKTSTSTLQIICQWKQCLMLLQNVFIILQTVVNDNIFSTLPFRYRDIEL